MKITILGAGVIGVTSAYVLASRGHEVTILERNSGPAEETSFANGGQLSYSHAEPWSNPGVPAKLPKWLLKEDSPLIFRPRADLRMMWWGLRFLWHCRTASSRQNCVDMLKLGMYSKDRMADIRRDTAIDFDFSDKGIVHIFSSEHELEEARIQVEFQENYGGDERMISREEVLKLEPTLRHTQRDIVGGMHAHLDESGDPHLYCKALCDYMTANLGVEIKYNTDVLEICEGAGRITHVRTNNGDEQADAYVVSLASFSRQYVRPHGVRLPVYPMKGYSLTVPVGDDAPQMSITDGSYKIVYSRLGDRLRVAGTAEFAGYDTDLVQSRITPILAATKALLPQVDWEADRTEWACIRPSTPDGPPRIGKTKLPNLFLNTGHGTLGWTQCAGSAYLLADIIDGKTPAVESYGPMVAN